MEKSFFDPVLEAPQDPILGLTQLFESDQRPNKVNLSVGLYYDATLKTPIMKAVKQAEEELLSLEQKKTYLPIEGDPLYLNYLGQLVFGETFWHENLSRIAAAQTLGGTGGLRTVAEFLEKEKTNTLVIPNPSWPNHQNIFLRARFSVGFYPYYNTHAHEMVWDETLSFFQKLKEKSAVLFHACCHNPTGFDFDLPKWKTLSKVLLEKKVFPIFDFAYQGFGRGIDRDAEAIRLFAKEGHEFAVCVSNSKNFGLYGERVGALFVVTNHSKTALPVLSQIKATIRANYSNPPKHGAMVVGKILSTPSLFSIWKEELQSYQNRLEEMRRLFVKELSSQISLEKFHFLGNALGLFSFTGLQPEQVMQLREKYGIYMIGDGRINITGLNQDNLERVVNSIRGSTL